jgi:hypothetical protein
VVAIIELAYIAALGVSMGFVSTGGVKAVTP